jgi:hypothetical protein
MKIAYLPDTLEGKLVHVTEECAEVIHAACKIQRWGWNSTNPDSVSQLSNGERLQLELRDLRGAVERLEDALRGLDCRSGE